MHTANFPQFVNTVQKALDEAQIKAFIEKGELSEGKNYFFTTETPWFEVADEVNQLFKNLVLDGDKIWNARVGIEQSDLVVTFVHAIELPVLENHGFSGLNIYRHLEEAFLPRPLSYDAAAKIFTVLNSTDLTKDNFETLSSEVGFNIGFDGYTPVWAGKSSEGLCKFRFKEIPISMDGFID